MDSDVRADGCELWLETRAISGASAGGFKNSRALHTGRAQKKSSGAVEATLSVSVEIERMEKPWLTAEWVVRYYRLGAGPQLRTDASIFERKQRCFRLRLIRQFEETQGEGFDEFGHGSKAPESLSGPGGSDNKSG